MTDEERRPFPGVTDSPAFDATDDRSEEQLAREDPLRVAGHSSLGSQHAGHPGLHVEPRPRRAWWRERLARRAQAHRMRRRDRNELFARKERLLDGEAIAVAGDAGIYKQGTTITGIRGPTWGAASNSSGASVFREPTRTEQLTGALSKQTFYGVRVEPTGPLLDTFPDCRSWPNC